MLELLYIVDGGVKWHNHYEKQYGRSSNNYTQNFQKTQQFTFWASTHKNWKHSLKETLYVQVQSSTIHNIWKAEATQMSTYHWWMNG